MSSQGLQDHRNLFLKPFVWFELFQVIHLVIKWALNVEEYWHLAYFILVVKQKNSADNAEHIMGNACNVLSFAVIAQH